MTERNFSANFFLYRPDGVKVQLTVREDDANDYVMQLDALFALAYQRGYSPTEPVAGAGEKVERIQGFVVGGYDDKGGAFKRCVHLYADDQRTFKCATIYPENFHQLPFNPEDFKPWDGVAPDIDTARKRGVFNDKKFEIVVVPKLDADTGQPLTSDKGRIQYKFKQVKGVQPVGHRGYEEAIAPLPEDGLAPWDGGSDGIDDVIELQAAAAMAGSGRSDGHWQVRRNELNIAGREAYGDDWPDRCNALAVWYGQVHAKRPLENPEQMRVAELDGLIIKLREKAAKAKVRA